MQPFCELRIIVSELQRKQNISSYVLQKASIPSSPPNLASMLFFLSFLVLQMEPSVLCELSKHSAAEHPHFFSRQDFTVCPGLASDLLSSCLSLWTTTI